MFALLLSLLTTLSPVAAEPWLSEGTVPVAIRYRLTTLATGLEHPWGMAWLPDGRILITERPGRLRLLDDNGLQAEPLAGVPPVFAAGQGGLLDIALHPNFETEPWVYFTYSAGTSEANHTRVGRARWQDDALVDWEDIFSVEPLKSGTQHFGARLTWLPDETLLVAIGDGGNPPLQLAGELIREQAQDLDSELGKVVRLNADGSVPADNPWGNRLWSIGHRNIQGMAIDPLTNEVWASEHGPRGGDELNRVEAGANYGWPVTSYGAEYGSGRPVGQLPAPEDMVEPVAAWIPTSKAPSGLVIYRGDAFSEWDGDILSGGLVTRDVRRLILEEGRVIREESIPIGQRVRDVRQGPEGSVYVLTDESNGVLMRIDPS